MTSMLVALIGAAAIGGLLLVMIGLIGRRPSLTDTAAALHRPRQPGRRHEPGWLRPLLGAGSPQRDADLAVCERDGRRWVQDRLKWAAFGSGMGVGGTVMVPFAAGSNLSMIAAGLVTIAGAVGGWFYAVVDLHADAEKARRNVRHAVATYLELVTILMAGGAGPESAMFSAAGVGHGPAFRHLRSTLAAAQVRQEAPWALLAALGSRLGVVELVELGSSLTLAGGGAQVKDSLSAKASSIRNKDLAQTESEAQARSETMALPVVMMFTAFLLLLGYPALAGLSGP